MMNAKSPRRLLGAALALILFGGCGALSAAPQLHALVIGIDHYPGGKNLFGAVNDARLIERLAKDLQATTIKTLYDGEATRQSIFEAWSALQAQSKPGDTLLISFAGHGAQYASGDSKEIDGRDEYFVLGGHRQNACEVIVDNEWAALFDEARDRKIVFVADACHSGTPSRSVVEPKYAFPSRTGVMSEAPRDCDLPIKPYTGGNQAHVMVLGATLDEKEVLEISHGGQNHGALSVAFDATVRGGDTDGDGALSGGELLKGVRAGVMTLADQGQIPQINVGDQTRSARLLSALPARPVEVFSATVAVENPVAGMSTAGLQLGQRPSVDFVWDQSAAILYRTAEGYGRPVAKQIEGVEAVRGELLRWEARQLLLQLPQAEQPLPLRGTAKNPGSACKDSSTECRGGDQVLIGPAAVRDRPHTAYFNLSATGKVFWLDGAVNTCVVAPFGIEHVYAVHSSKELEKPRDLPTLMAILRPLQQDPRALVESASLYTVPGTVACTP